jgi:hypothetical protein
MAKKITLEALAAQMAAGFTKLDEKISNLDGRMEKGFAASDKKFAAVADDISHIKRDMTTKDQLFAVQTQAASIETQLRDMRHVKLQSRVANFEEEIFGKSRG